MPARGAAPRTRYRSVTARRGSRRLQVLSRRREGQRPGAARAGAMRCPGRACGGGHRPAAGRGRPR
eukprot:517714-Alexandrium_andersonii.AAC.1